MKDENKQAIGAVVVVIVTVAIFVLGATGSDGIQFGEKLRASYRKTNALTLNDFKNTSEMKALLEKNVPEEVVVSYVLGPTYTLNSAIYPASSGGTVIVELSEEKGLRSMNLETAQAQTLFGENETITPRNVTPVKIVRFGIDYPSAQIEFQTFDTELYHKTFTLFLEIEGSYTYYSQGVNTYSTFALRSMRDVDFFTVSPEEMTLLNILRDLCKSSYCFFSEELNNLYE